MAQCMSCKLTLRLAQAPAVRNGVAVRRAAVPQSSFVRRPHRAHTSRAAAVSQEEEAGTAQVEEDVAEVDSAAELDAEIAEEEQAEAVEAAATAAAESEEAAAVALEDPAQYALNFLWLEKNVAVSVDQVFGKVADNNLRSPLTEYFFWPKRDAWEELKATLESKPWISERDKVLLLNRTTEVINYWQESEAKHSLDEARTQFPDCVFLGS